MTDDFYTANNMHLLKAKKMATWRNADAKLEAADVTAIDDVIDISLDEPKSIVTQSGGASYLPHYIESGYVPGLYSELLYFQSGINLYPALGTCTTADDTPGAGFYQKTFGLRTTQAPLNMGRHWERENDDDNESERIDIMGMCLRNLHIECSEASQVATQLAIWGCAFTLNTGTEDLTPANISLDPYRWEHFSFTTSDEDNETLEANIIGWSFDVNNTILLTGPDSSGYYQKGVYIPQTVVTTTLEILPHGHNPFENIRTALGDYTNDFNITVSAVQTTNEHSVIFTHDKVYAYTFTLRSEKRSGFVERYFVRLAQLDTGSIVPVEISTLDDDYYET